VLRMRADVSRATDVLAFTPRILLRDGLRLILERDPRFALA
jgi:nucleoside-diphosphate-sugar epimerase